MTLLPRSSATGVIWPALPGPDAALLLALQAQLQESQWWSLQQLQVLQGKQLLSLLSHARKTVPFYGSRLASLELDDEVGVYEEFQQIPCLGRAELQQHEAALLSTAFPEDHLPIRNMRSSGSTGRPVRVKGSRITALFHSALTIRNHLWQGHDFSGKLANARVLYGDEEPRLSSWSEVYPTGPMVLQDSGTDVDKQLAWLQRERPQHLLTYPSNLLALAKRAMEQGITLQGLRHLSTQGEVLSEEVRNACQVAWGLKVDSSYSCQEAGFLALQCPQSDHYHVQSENVLLEVLDEKGEPCVAGEVGRVVLTTLHNFATPLIRYEIGDYAEVGDACACGRGLPVLRRVLGRARNMLKRPNGASYWPPISLSDWVGERPIEQIQVVQKQRDQLEVKLVAKRRLNPEEEAALRQQIDADLGAGYGVTILHCESIARSPGGKFEDFICECD